MGRRCGSGQCGKRKGKSRGLVERAFKGNGTLIGGQWLPQRNFSRYAQEWLKLQHKKRKGKGRRGCGQGGRRRGKPYDQVKQRFHCDGLLQRQHTRIPNFSKWAGGFIRYEQRLKRDALNAKWNDFRRRKGPEIRRRKSLQMAANVIKATSRYITEWIDGRLLQVFVMIYGKLYSVKTDRRTAQVFKNTKSGPKCEFYIVFCVYCHFLTLFTVLHAFGRPGLRNGRNYPDGFKSSDLRRFYRSAKQMKKSFRTGKRPSIIVDPNENEELINALHTVLTEPKFDPGLFAVVTDPASSSDDEDEDDAPDVDSNISAALDQGLADKPVQAVSATSEDDEDDASEVDSDISMGSIVESGAETEDISEEE